MFGLRQRTKAAPDETAFGFQSFDLKWLFPASVDSAVLIRASFESHAR